MLSDTGWIPPSTIKHLPFFPPSSSIQLSAMLKWQGYKHTMIQHRETPVSVKEIAQKSIA